MLSKILEDIDNSKEELVQGLEKLISKVILKLTSSQ